MDACEILTKVVFAAFGPKHVTQAAGIVDRVGISNCIQYAKTAVQPVNTPKGG